MPTTTPAPGPYLLTQLTDIVSTGLSDGDTLIYDEDTGNFVFGPGGNSLTYLAQSVDAYGNIVTASSGMVIGAGGRLLTGDTAVSYYAPALFSVNGNFAAKAGAQTHTFGNNYPNQNVVSLVNGYTAANNLAALSYSALTVLGPRDADALAVEPYKTKATATATISGTGVNTVSIGTAGAEYIVTPRVVFSGGGGSGAAATATVSGGQVTAINVTSAGTGYTSAPLVDISIDGVAIPGYGSADVSMVEKAAIGYGSPQWLNGFYRDTFYIETTGNIGNEKIPIDFAVIQTGGFNGKGNSDSTSDRFRVFRGGGFRFTDPNLGTNFETTGFTGAVSTLQNQANAGENTITVEGAEKFKPGEAYVSWGTNGSLRELVNISGVNSTTNVLTLSSALTKTHAAGRAIRQRPGGSDGLVKITTEADAQFTGTANIQIRNTAFNGNLGGLTIYSRDGSIGGGSFYADFPSGETSDQFMQMYTKNFQIAYQPAPNAYRAIVQGDNQMNLFLGRPAPATNATSGLMWVPLTNGTPTGTPNNNGHDGYAPMMADSGGNKLWIYLNGAWKSITLS